MHLTRRRFVQIAAALAAMPAEVARMAVSAAAAAVKAGGRQFNVTVNGKTVITNLDIIGDVGPNTADVKTLTVSPVNGVLTVGFVPGAAGQPIVSGIEILPISPPPPPPPPPAPKPTKPAPKPRRH